MCSGEPKTTCSDEAPTPSKLLIVRTAVRMCSGPLEFRGFAKVERTIIAIDVLGSYHQDRVATQRTRLDGSNMSSADTNPGLHEPLGTSELSAK